MRYVRSHLFRNIQYNALGRQSDTYDQLQRHTQYAYDVGGRYDSLGRVDTSLTRQACAPIMATTAMGRLNSVTQHLNFGQANPAGAGDPIRIRRSGQRVPQTDANQHTTKYVHDQLGRRISRTLPRVKANAWAN